MRRLFSIFTSALFAVSYLLPTAAGATSGATMSLSPTNKTVNQGSEFSVAVQLQAPTAADRFNSADVTLSFPVAKLQVVSISKTGSVFSMWPEEPSYSNTDGTVRFAGGRTSGFQGTGTAVTIRFRTAVMGDAAVTMTSGQVLANDGRGTNLLSTFIPGHYAVANASGFVSLSAGDLIKLPDDGNAGTTVDTAVYYYGADGLRYVFPNSKTYFTWYSDFNNVKEVNSTQLGTIGLGGNATYRPGVKMIKIESDPKVYAIDRGGVKRHIGSEAVAVALYGSNWNTQIDDVSDSFFSNYTLGDALATGTTWRATVARDGVTSISSDKVLAAPVEVSINADGTFTPSSVTVLRVRTVRFTNNTTSAARVVSDPHPGHSGLPGFDSANIPSGLNYVYRFTQSGTFGFHNEGNVTKTGSVVVTP